jgi:predicted adenine nucleotide alpha hydrolase (AANH) superfamily ATPase
MKDKLLLVSCCAPCSVGVIKDLKEQRVDFTVLFYNPNIQPKEEYIRRLEENKKVCQLFNVPFVDLEYTPELWQKMTKGLENEPEKGKRCDICFYMRLKRASEYAKANGFTRISSVLGISRWKDFDQVCRAGKKVETETGVIYDTTNWRKEGRLEKSEKLSKELGLYRQKYCGCKPKFD